MVVRNSEADRQGVRSFETSRYALGYVLSGRKYLYTGDARWEVSPGDIFFMGRGIHFVENIPARSKRGFEEIIFFYTPEQVGSIIANLTINYNLNTCLDHTCEECMRRDHVIAPGWPQLNQFFNSILEQVKAGFLENNSTLEMLSLSMLVYLIVDRPESCLRTRVLGSTDPEKELMERVMHEFIYSDMTLDELAKRNNRSLSSFKKKFREYFGEAPHRWVVRKRLMNARLQIIQTNKTSTQISNECNFSNTSHFIKLFQKEYGLTPFQYRRKYRSEESFRARQDDILAVDVEEVAADEPIYM